jgi:hypothetical protein
MPDLTVEYHWACMSNMRVAFDIKGSKGNTYRVDAHRPRGDQAQWHCTCKGFEFRGKCKHVEQAKKKVCGWNAFLQGGEPVDVPVDDEHPNGKACPKCGGEITSIGWGV